MSRLLPTFRPSGGLLLWAVCGLVAVSLTQSTGNQNGIARAGVGLCCYEADKGRFPKLGSLYESFNPAQYQNPQIPIELLSMSLQSSSSLSIALPQPGTPPVQMGSFFDIFVELRVPGQSTHVDSFFDVFVDFSMRGISGSPTEAQVAIEMLQLELQGTIPPSALPPGNIDPLPFIIRETQAPSSPPSLGAYGLTELSPGGPYRIDSFFDVFTEISLDGRFSWTQASGPIQMELTRFGVPEPASLMLAGVIGLAGLAVHIRRWMKR